MKGAHLCDMEISMVGHVIAWSKRHVELDWGVDSVSPISWCPY